MTRMQSAAIAFLTTLLVTTHALAFAPSQQGWQRILTSFEAQGISLTEVVEPVSLCKQSYFPEQACAGADTASMHYKSNKLSMRKQGDINAKSHRALVKAGFKHQDEAKTFDNGLYFYQCSNYSLGTQRLSLHVFGINEHPSVGWFFSVALASSVCQK